MTSDHSEDANVFQRSVLDRWANQDAEDSATAAAEAEADFAGPWTVAPWQGQWAVHAEGEPPEAVMASQALALLGHLRHFNPELSHALHVVECLRRAPADLARLLLSTPHSSLARAGRLLSLWEVP